ncbi:uncharacterized protein LOC115078645 [Rhinatrema bivittatum]|uniref:uncharacterized protein LOC115078645 n=1 Tax=Rhinatrema bivittatum TaxID=194408 RepID=UPI00112DA3E9|nr:uncharacterized protein LOC115078645 [Rhinatrema bivittatum]
MESRPGKVEAEEADVIINPVSSAYDCTDSPLFFAAGDSVQQEFRRKEDRYGLTCTGPGKLRCKIIIHVRQICLLSQQDTLKKILEDCDSKREYRSVCLFISHTAVIDWVTSNSASESSQATEVSWQQLRAKSASKPAELQLFAEKQETLRRASQTIGTHFASLYSQHVLQHPALRHLTERHLQEMHPQLCRSGVAKDCLKLEGTEPEVERARDLVERALRELKAPEEEAERKWLLAVAPVAVRGAEGTEGLQHPGQLPAGAEAISWG